MRARLTGVALLGAALLATGGCGGAPAGLDGKLTNDWGALPEAKLVEPAVGDCYLPSGSHLENIARWPEPLACTASHLVETFHVGTFTGAAAGATPPPAGSPARRDAYVDCARRAVEFLGADWRTGRTWMIVTVPSAAHWQVGARYYRCDLAEVNALKDPVQRQSSLKGALAGDHQLRYGCYTYVEQGESGKLAPADCGAAHQAEFAGVHDAPDGPYPAAGAWDALAQGCYGVIAGYVGVPNDANLVYRTGHVSQRPPKQEWDQGNRGIRCYIWPGRDVNRSLRGAGPSGLPVR